MSRPSTNMTVALGSSSIQKNSPTPTKFNKTVVQNIQHEAFQYLLKPEKLNCDYKGIA